ncbi:tol-pal system YbgF family protein [Helicobacter sp. MIT 14-3879]|uniref:tetratricopeptide repeat protein n=1 Tax=Helicobacter sp. MIT 14-3879 TaxID=2040649 RepID=UPI000E1F2AF0|nr:hypothetical protein [Helicobacter sp. MIT 14-3879]RDU65223.1 hypothetical protein CQA44_02605 [Helicobacter sp. MIT 14-3879]
MKKIIELESRWRSYKYKAVIFYLFIIVFIIFIVLLGFFIKLQYDKRVSKNNIIASKQIIKKEISSNVNNNETQSNIIKSDDIKRVKTDNTNKINFICKKVIVDKLAVRSLPDFKSKSIGYYALDSIFCAQNENVNGLIKTTNGWVSANDKFSKVVDVNMFVDSGFYKYQNIAKNTLKPRSSAFEEVKVFDKPQDIQSASNIIANNNMVNETNNIKTFSQDIPKNKPIININSQKLTKETIIELKKSDFKNTNDYDTAIEIAKFYYEAKDYQNSLKWALNASNADSKGKQKTESWIIYAKSLYISGKKEQAIEVLNRYITSTSSPDAMDVLNNMKQGII